MDSQLAVQLAFALLYRRFEFLWQSGPSENFQTLYPLPDFFFPRLRWTGLRQGMLSHASIRVQPASEVASRGFNLTWTHPLERAKIKASLESNPWFFRF